MFNFHLHERKSLQYEVWSMCLVNETLLGLIWSYFTVNLNSTNTKDEEPAMPGYGTLLHCDCDDGWQCSGEGFITWSVGRPRMQHPLITGPPPQVQLEVKWHPPLTSSQWEHTLLLLLRVHPATFQLPVVLSASFVHHLPAQSLPKSYCNYADWQSLELLLSLWILTALTFSVKTHIKMSSIVQPCKDVKMCCCYHGQ